MLSILSIKYRSYQLNIDHIELQIMNQFLQQFSSQVVDIDISSVTKGDISMITKGSESV